MTINIQIKRKKMKNIIMRFVPPNTLKISAPKNIGTDKINSFINDKKDWIDKQYKKYMAFSITEEIESVMYMGEKYPLIKSDDITRCMFLNDKFLISSSLSLQQQKEVIKKLLMKMFDDIVKSYLSIKLKQKAKEFKIKMPKNIKTRLMKSRYGSYSKKTDTICLNSMLICYNEDVIFSVMLHELCHTKYMNHKAEFYKLLYEIDPKYKINHNLLKQDISQKNCFILRKED